MAKKTSNAQVVLLLRMLDEGFNKSAWHGPNIRGAIRRVDAEQAGWRAGPERKTIADHTVHAAYWKYVARRRLTGEKRGSFPLKGSNWFELEQPLSTTTWKSYVKLADETHQGLREVVCQLSDRDLSHVTKGAKIDIQRLLYGIALHDVYHAGQIQLLKRLYASRET